MVPMAKERLSLTILTGKFYVKSLITFGYYESNSQFAPVPSFPQSPRIRTKTDLKSANLYGLSLHISFGDLFYYWTFFTRLNTLIRQ